MSNVTDNNPLVSIIMNCRNGQEYLREAIDSIFAQSYINWEIIFWDNDSTDESPAIARSYGEKLRYFKSGQPLSLGKARNMALAEARGRYIAFLDCDDKWLVNKLDVQVDLLGKNQEFDFVYSNYYRQIASKANKLVLTLKGKQPEGDVFGQFLINYPAGLLTVMLRREAIKRMNAEFDEYLELSEEFDFFMRILLRSKALYINQPLAVYRIHPNMSSRKLIERHPFEMQYIFDKLKKLDTSIQEKYSSEFKYYQAKLGYWFAKAEMEKHGQKAARGELEDFKFVDFKFFSLYVLTYLPVFLWRWLHRYK
jgi:glycosyltransferase involved in cell wall biosynthesis